MISAPSFKRGFSLVETLVVLAIMSVLTVVTVASVSVIRSEALTSSGNQMVDVFAMARQDAMAKNAYVLVLIKTQGAGAYSSYCLLELTRQDDGSFGSWTAITPWRSLGSGVVFESGQANDTFISNTSSLSLPQPLPTSFRYHDQTLDLTAAGVVAYECYQPDGTLTGGQNSALCLRLITGTVDPSTGVFTYQGSTVSGKPVSYYDLVVVSNTGMTKIERP